MGSRVEGRVSRPGPAWAWALPAAGWLLGCAAQLQMAALWDAGWVWIGLSKALVLAALLRRLQARVLLLY